MVTQQRPMCRFWLRGECKKGMECPFSHDNARGDSFQCPYYQKGTCKYGAACMYDHQVQPTHDRDARHEGLNSTANPYSDASAGRSVTVSCNWGRLAPVNGFREQVQGQVDCVHRGNITDRQAPSAQPAGEKAEAPEGRVLCAYFAQRGCCQYGERCRFWHGATTAAGSAFGTSSSTAVQTKQAGLTIRSPSTAECVDQSMSGLASLWIGEPPGRGGGGNGLLIRPPAQSAWESQRLHAPKERASESRVQGTVEHSGLTIFNESEDLRDPWRMAEGATGAHVQRRACASGDGGQPGSAELRSTGWDGAEPLKSELFCQTFTMSGACPAGEECEYIHGDVCPVCCLPCLHPTNQDVREQHLDACAETAQQTYIRTVTAEKECAICMDRVVGRAIPAERRFGLMNCEHCFCLTCIRSWRENTAADVEATRSCPLCRTVTHFVTPTEVWPVTKEQKDDIIGGYRAALSSKHCRYFDKGNGSCPFGTSCFYRHEYEDGTLQERTPLYRRAVNADGEHIVIQPLCLASFRDARPGWAVFGRGR